MDINEDTIKEVVDSHMNEWRFADDLIYDTIVRIVWNLNLHEIKENEVNDYIKTFLNNWGIMGRVLAKVKKKNENWEKDLADVIQNKHIALTTFKALHLENSDIESLTQEIKECYGDIKKIVGPTAAGKTLHLLCPDFFPLWDQLMRENMRIRDNGDGYYYFMLVVQSILRKYDSIISELAEKYRKPKLRILDAAMYMLTRPKKEKTNAD